MTNITIAWIVLPFSIALIIYLIPKLARWLALGTPMLSAGYALKIFLEDCVLDIQLLDNFGVTLAVDRLSDFFILANAIVTTAVILYCWQSEKTAFFYTQMVILHGSVFLILGSLPSRNFKQLQSQPINTSAWIVLAIASLAISGFPLLSGFGAKIFTTNNLLPWQIMVMNLATVGTVIVFAKFIFLPHQKKEAEEQVQSGIWWAMAILLGGLIVANAFYYQAYTLDSIVKQLVTIAIGWLLYLFIFKRLVLELPKTIEKLEHLIGTMTLMLILIFSIIMNTY